MFWPTFTLLENPLKEKDKNSNSNFWKVPLVSNFFIYLFIYLFVYLSIYLFIYFIIIIIIIIISSSSSSSSRSSSSTFSNQLFLFIY